MNETDYPPFMGTMNPNDLKPINPADAFENKKQANTGFDLSAVKARKNTPKEEADSLADALKKKKGAPFLRDHVRGDLVTSK